MVMSLVIDLQNKPKHVDTNLKHDVKKKQQDSEYNNNNLSKRDQLINGKCIYTDKYEYVCLKILFLVA